MRNIKSFLLFFLLAYAAGATAQIVECTDASGKKTYAKECPVNTLKKKDLGDPSLVSPGTPLSASGEKLRQQNDEFEKRRAERLKSGDAAKDKAAGAKQSEQACNDAKARLDALQSGKQSKRVDPTTGDHVALDEPDRQAEIDKLNAQVAANCK